MIAIRVLAAAVLTACAGVAACGGRTDQADAAADGGGAGGVGVDASSGQDAPSDRRGPPFWTVPGGSSQVGDWAFSKSTLTFTPVACSSPPTGGSLRFEVPTFSLDETPITNGLYAQCVAAGSCDAPVRDIADPDPRAWDDPERRDIRVLVSQRQAQTYCDWTGGRPRPR
jgi:formylglycine-generating enzyme required for sulfatase activity